MNCSGAVPGWRVVHNRGLLLSKRQRELDYAWSQFVLMADEARVHERLGYGSLGEYVATVFGCSFREASERVRVARRLAELEKEADKRFIDFVYKVAGEMDAQQSKRYLQKMKGWLERAGEVSRQ